MIKVSKNDNCHCAGTTNVAAKRCASGTPEEESLEATSDNRHRECGRDMLGADCSKYGSATGKA